MVTYFSKQSRSVKKQMFTNKYPFNKATATSSEVDLNWGTVL